MTIKHDPAARRFEIELPSGTAFLAYAPAGDRVLDLYSTYVPPPARGKSVGSELVQAAVDYARREGFRIIASCWYVDLWLRGHPEHRDLVAA